VSIPPDLDIKFSPFSDITWDNFNIEFFTWVTLLSPILPTQTWSFTFSWFTQDVDYLTWSSNWLNYSFVDSFWSWRLLTFTWWNDYWIYVNNIIWTSPVLSWSFYVNLSLLSWSTLMYSDYYPYFVLSDNSIVTKHDNVLKVITWWLSYPTWIYYDWTNILVNDFLTREKLTISVTWSLINTWSLSKFDFSTFDYNKKFDEILNTPINSIVYNYTSNLLTIILKYYKSYNCYDNNEKVNRTFILKKSF
jgi:hypothetical protein